jgi:ActR/RegA family two-component response regulator
MSLVMADDDPDHQQTVKRAMEEASLAQESYSGFVEIMEALKRFWFEIAELPAH